MRQCFLLFAIIVAVAFPVAPAWAQANQARIGMLEIEGHIPGRPNEFAWLAAKPKPTLRDLVETVERSAEREDIDMLVVRLKDAQLQRTQIEELGEAMMRARDNGRTVHVFAEHFTPAEILLGTYADSVIVQQGGAVIFPGLYLEEMYLAETLGWLGIRADFVQVGDYKGAAEAMTNAQPSPEWDENVTQLLDSMYDIMRRDVMRGRGLSDEELDEAMRRVWVGLADDGIEVGLIDTAVDLPKLGEMLAEEREARFVDIEPAREKRREVDTGNPFAAITQMMDMFTKTPRHRPTRPTIAVVHIDGPIVDGDSSAGGLFGGTTVGSRTIRNVLEQVRAENQIKGVIVRIDSPGGSATASEVMWQGLRRVAEEKPVWVSIGGMAASGGYYVAVGGDRIYVNPSSIVGSIGVVGGKIALGGLYEKLGINVVGRGRGPMAGMFSTAEPWTEEQRQLVRTRMQDIYDLFTRRVSQGREEIDLAQTAEGRLFTGQRAVELKMADQIGGLEMAIADLAQEVNLPTYDVMHYPGPRGLDQLFEDLFRGFGADTSAPVSSFMTGELLRAVGQAVGPLAWPEVAAQLEALAQLRREPAVLVSPRALIFR